MKLSTLAEAVHGARVTAGGDTEIGALCYDSRKAEDGALFFALCGNGVDGHDFIRDAMDNGTSAVVTEKMPKGDKFPHVKVADSRGALSAMANVFYGQPSRSLKVAGITGTNGKTTTALLLHSLLNDAHQRCGLLGTVHNDLGGEIEKSTHTTPESSDLQRLLAAMVDNGCRAVAMEVSSHGLDQGRTADVEFDAAIFTNLTRDHLDYHGDMVSYFNAKRILFTQLAASKEKKGLAVINIDDTWGKKLIQDVSGGSAKLVTYGMGVGADYRASDIKQLRDGIEFKLEAKGRQFRVRIPLIGRFNVYNALAALATGVGLGLNLRETVANLAHLPQVPGRLQSVSEGRAFNVYVDYAHTPDALENALNTLKELDHRRIILVFGCGGSRDIPKRKLMGEVADRLANYTIITSDNPRDEDPEAIIRDIESGFKGEQFESISDRRDAIAMGVSYLAPRDILLIAGKGHEDYQIFANETIEFDDRDVARQMLNDRDRARQDMVWEMRREEDKRKAEREERERRNPRRDDDDEEGGRR